MNDLDRGHEASSAGGRILGDTEGTGGKPSDRRSVQRETGTSSFVDTTSTPTRLDHQQVARLPADNNATLIQTNVPISPNPSDLPASIRNTTMQPADCLLFAASLLDGIQQPQHHGMSATPLPTTTLQMKKRKASRGSEGRDNHASSALGSLSNPKSIEPRKHDVLCGRGGMINKHPGNIVYRRVVEHNKALYSKLQKRHRILVSQSIVRTILDYEGRFLMQCDGNRWVEIDFKRAVQKTSQALRERPIVGSRGADEHDGPFENDTS